MRHAQDPTGASLLDKSKATPGSVNMSIFEKKGGGQATSGSSGQMGQGTTSSDYLQKTREDNPDPVADRTAESVTLANCRITTDPTKLAPEQPFEMEVEVKGPASAATGTVTFNLFCHATKADGSEDCQDMASPVQGQIKDGKVVAQGTLAAPAGATSGTSIFYSLAAQHPNAPEKAISPKVEVEAGKTSDPLAVWSMNSLHFGFDSSFILPTSADQLAKLKDLFAKHAGAVAAVFGHADPVGEDDANKKLSGRRSWAVYCLLTKNVDGWKSLSDGTHGEKWDLHVWQQMLAHLRDTSGKPYYTDIVDGKTGPNTEKAIKGFKGGPAASTSAQLDDATKAKLTKAYMDSICAMTLKPEDFVGDPKDPKRQWACNGCGEFNPVLVFSKSDDDNFRSSGDKPARNRKNAPNRRATVALYPAGAKGPGKVTFPCPPWTEGVAKCQSQFFDDAQKRRNPSDKERTWEKDKDTFACKFYAKIGDQPAAPPADDPIPDEIWTKPCFATEKEGNKIEALVHGDTAMKAICEALRSAQATIRISDWIMTADIPLIRDGIEMTNSVFSRVLLERAQAGVQIRILLWKSSSFNDNNDTAVETALENLHPNIRVSRHTPGTYWSHHQKFVVVDGKVALLGGIDIAAGRWDVDDHPVVADARWPNIDFYNSCLEQPGSRNDSPRLPWHDVHVRIEGPAASDVDLLFVDRWNFERTSGNNEAAITYAPAAAPIDGAKGWAQIHRSADAKSCGLAQTERSILDMYLNLISIAKHHIHIENQFFTSNFGTATVSNGIANALFQRINKAIQDGHDDFRVTVVLPARPEGDINAWTTQELMHWQYQTIIRSGAGSLLGRVRAALGPAATDEDVAKRISFHCMRNHGSLAGTPVTEQIYAHIKCMIVDDSWAVVGSANINDRSMLGDRDSEIAVLIADETSSETTFNNTAFKARKFAKDLRMQLWKEHLAASDQEVEDPFGALWNDRSRSNTTLFESVFPRIPRNGIALMADYQSSLVVDPSQVGKLSGIKGFLCDFPLNFLVREDLETTGYPDPIFTLAPIQRPGSNSPYAIFNGTDTALA